MPNRLPGKDEAPRTVIAITAEDDHYRATRLEAMDRARAAHATLILYDLDAGRNPLESPLPTEWDGEGEAEAVGDRLGPEELDASGRGSIADQVRRARADGLDAWGWLPAKDDRETLVTYALKQPAPLLVVPEDETDLADIDLADAIVTTKSSNPRGQAT
jgi:hypothetical protein